MERRTFLFQSSALAAAGLLLPVLDSDAARIKKPGIQLYSLRSLMKQDCSDVLKKLGAMGYKEIESFPSEKGHFWGKSAKDFFALAKDCGLKVVSTHIPYGKPVNNAPDAIASLSSGFEAFVESFAREGGQYLVCPDINATIRTTIDHYSAAADDFNKAGELCKKYGIRFAYHNHDFEFAPINDIIPYHHLLTRTDPALVHMELDLYWLEKAMQPVDFLFERFPGRFPLVHVKDMGSGTKETVEVGTGTIRFKEIFARSKQAGIQHYFVEQDNFQNGDPMKSVKTSLDYLKKLRF
jgi:sugar phosphate isomerase/epimerase